MSFYKGQTKGAYARQYKNILAKHMKQFVILFLFSSRERGLATFCTWVVHFYLCLFTSELEHKTLANWKYISKNVSTDDKTLNTCWTVERIIFSNFPSFCYMYVSVLCDAWVINSHHSTKLASWLPVSHMKYRPFPNLGSWSDLMNVIIQAINIASAFCANLRSSGKEGR